MIWNQLHTIFFKVIVTNSSIFRVKPHSCAWIRQCFPSFIGSDVMDLSVVCFHAVIVLL